MESRLDDVRSYKPFVDGLRAIAILTVVGCHVGVPGFSGGYVGVDIFFVISGYLIIGQIEADVARGRFRILDFAARRALRILPAFLLVMIVCLILVSTVFLQFDYSAFADSFVASAVMLSNHYFLGRQGYFDAAAFTLPLLHMWSLSVEEQFYLVTPFAILALYALTRRLPESKAARARDAITALLALASFAACIAFSYGVSHNPAFYLMPMRGWEFIVGGRLIAAVGPLRFCSRRTVDLLALAGIAAIAFAVLSFDAATRYPTFRAAAPVLGTALIIACGIARPDNIVARVLATRPMVAIGLVSFAWYLWHWPLLTFLRTSGFIGEGTLGAATVAAFALVLAALTYLFVERPIRQWRRAAKPRSLPVTVSMLSACLLVGCAGYAWSRYVAPKLLPEVAGFAPAVLPQTPLPPVASRGLLVGDSHAAAMAPLLMVYARHAGAELKPAHRTSCPPLLHVDTDTWSGERIAGCKEGFAAIDFSGADFVVMVARWNYYLGLPWSDPFYPPPRLRPAQPGEPAEPAALLRRGLTALIARARDAGVKRILLVAPLPEFPKQVPDCLVRSLRLGIESCVIARSAVDARRAPAMEILRAIAAEFPSVRLLDPIAVFCTPQVCSPVEGRTLFFHDTNHIVAAGIERLYGASRGDFDWAFHEQQAAR